MCIFESTHYTTPHVSIPWLTKQHDYLFGHLNFMILQLLMISERFVMQAA